MKQVGKQAASKNMENKMTGMEKLLKKLATQLNVNISGKPRLPEILGTPDKPLATTSGRWNPADLSYFDFHLDKSYSKGNIIAINKKT